MRKCLFDDIGVITEMECRVFFFPPKSAHYYKSLFHRCENCVAIGDQNVESVI